MTGQTLSAELGRMAAAAGDFGTAFFIAAGQFRDAAEDHFQSEGGGQWPAWSDSYTARNRSSRLLFREGDLFDSFTSRGHADHVQRVTDTSLEVGSSRSVANFHRGGGGKLPRRDPMPEERTYSPGWIQTIHQHVIEQGTVTRMGV